MSLVQLLSVGKSLLNIQDKPSPYRMRQENLLPNFGREASPRARKQTRAEKQVTRKEPKVKESQDVKVKRGLPLLRWVKAVNPFARKEAAAAAVTAEKAPVQAELLLDSVRPVRNDLHEADLMVVPARAPEKQPVAAPRETEPAGAGSKSGSRIFGNK